MNKYNFENILKEFAPFLDDEKNNIALLAANYALSAGGKRFRFSLSLNAAECFCSQQILNSKNPMRLAVAVELIHNYSLVHDDLPSMDNADYRRGVLSCQKKFGEAQAILAGDGLLNLASEVLFGGIANTQYLKASKYLLECSGFLNMILGQSLDIQDKIISFEEYKNLAQLKTSKLICASVVPQAILADVTPFVIEKLTDYCNLLGLIYQFVDDYFDEEEDYSKPSILSYFSKKKAKDLIVTMSKDATKILIELSALDGRDYTFLQEKTDAVIKILY